MDAQPTAAAAGTIDVGGDLTVNRLGFGAMRITGPGIWGDPPSRDQAIATLRRVVELGINFIDTADSYGPEVSETLIAEALHPYPDDLVIATKGGLVRPGPSRWDADGRPEHLREACEGSLRRLRLEQIPLYQYHRPDPKVPLADSLGALADRTSIEFVFKVCGFLPLLGLLTAPDDRSASAVMLNCGPAPLSCDPNARKRSRLGPSVPQQPARCFSTRKNGNASCPAGTGVCVVNTVVFRISSSATSKLDPCAIRSRMRCSTTNAACPSFR